MLRKALNMFTWSCDVIMIVHVYGILEMKYTYIIHFISTKISIFDDNFTNHN